MAFLLPGNASHLLRKPVVTIGTFDGVHLGHRAILAELKQHAFAIGGESVVITFEPHPRSVLQPQANISILTPLTDKLRLLADAGIDHVAVTSFTLEFAALSADAYISDFLVNRFHPAAVVIGYDHRFGHDRAGGIATLRSANQFAVHEIPAQLISDAAVSSTRIRAMLLAGAVNDAATMLGRCYTLRGLVVKGDQIGRTISYPTANISPLSKEQLVPADGIYAVRATVGGTTYGGMLSIGFRPTINDARVRSIEVNLFDFSGDIYGQELQLHFVERMRVEEKFDSLETLKAALVADERHARQILSQS